jgi:hypothetical protein
MKSQQVNFYLLPEEQEWFETTLKECDDFVVVTGMNSPMEPQIVNTTVIQQMGQEKLTIYLCRSLETSCLVARSIPTRKLWVVDELRSPVVEYTRCYFDGGLLRRGRLYVVGQFFDDAGQRVEKNPGFVLWAKSLITKAKSVLKRRDDGDYIGPKALQALESGQIRISPF